MDNQEPPNEESHLQEMLPVNDVTSAEINQQVATARRYPRILSKVKQDMLSFATLDEETASSCFYTLPRGGKAIQGPSVRLAEIAISSYGNIRAGSRVVEVHADEANPHVVVQAVMHDLERNTAITIEKRRRIIKKKSKDKIDEDDITLACNAGAAVAFRDAAFKIIPQALIKPVFEAAKRVAVGEVKSLDKKRQQVLDRLKQMGVTEERVFSVVSARKADDIGMEQLEILIGIGTAIKDGELSLEEAFPYAPKTPGADLQQQQTPPTTQPQPQIGDPYEHLKGLMKESNVTEPQVLAYLNDKKLVKPGTDQLVAVSDASLMKVINAWPTVSKLMAGRPEQ